MLKDYTKETLQGKSFCAIKSSCPDVFCKKSDLRNFAKFTGTHLCQGLYFNKVAGLGLQLY